MSFLRKISAVLFIPVLFVQVAPVRGFSDISVDNFAYYSVQTLLSENVIDQATNYRPNADITRGEFVQMILRAKDAEDLGQNLLYTHLEKKHTYADLPDVPVGSPYAAAVSWAVSEGVISGKGDGLFHANDGLNRAEASKIITLAFFGGEMIAQNAPYFSDIDTSAWYYPYLLTVVSENIIRGYSDALGNLLGKFGPGNNLTRAEAAVILERCLGFEQNQGAQAGVGFNAYASDQDEVHLDFDQALTSTALTEAHFQIRNSSGEILRLASVSLEGDSGVILQTNPQTADEVYTLTIANLVTKSGQTLGTAGRSVSFLGYNPEGGALTVALSSDAKKGETLGSNAAQIEFLNLELTAGIENAVTVKSLEIKRRGLGTYDEIKNIRVMYDGDKLAEKNDLHSDNTVTLNFSPYLILRSGQTANLRVLADFAEKKDGTTYHSFEIVNAKSWGLTGEVEVEMSDRLQGPQYKRVPTASAMLVYTEEEVAGEIELEKTTTLAQVLLQAYNEDIELTKFIFENEGTVDDRCFEDVELRIDGRRVADRLDAANDERLIFDLGDKPYTLEQNSQETLTLKGKFTCGMSDTLALWIDDQSGVEATGSKFGYGAEILRGADSIASTTERKIGGGILVLSPSSNNPNNLLIYADGKSEKTIAAFRFEANGESLIFEDLEFELTTEGMENHFFEEITAYWGGREVETFSPGNLDSQTLEVSGPLELDANRTKTLTFKAKMGKILEEEEGNFQLVWHALTENGYSFDAEKVTDGSQLSREEISPSGGLTISGAEVRVREDI